MFEVKNQKIETPMWNFIGRREKAVQQGELSFAEVFTAQTQTTSSAASNAGTREKSLKAVEPGAADRSKKMETNTRDDATEPDSPDTVNETSSADQDSTPLASAEKAVPDDSLLLEEENQDIAAADDVSAAAAWTAIANAAVLIPEPIEESIRLTSEFSAASSSATPSILDTDQTSPSLAPALESFLTSKSDKVQGKNSDSVSAWNNQLTELLKTSASQPEPTADLNVLPQIPEKLSAANPYLQASTDAEKRMASPPTADEAAVKPALSQSADSVPQLQKTQELSAVPAAPSRGNAGQDKNAADQGQTSPHARPSAAHVTPATGKTSSDTSSPTIYNAQKNINEQMLSASSIVAENPVVIAVKEFSLEVSASDQTSPDAPAVNPSLGSGDLFGGKTVPAPASKAESLLVSAQETAENVDSIVRHVAAAHNRGESRVQIRLEPPELGTLRIDIQRQNDMMVLRFEAATPQTQQLLQQTAADLKAALDSQGFANTQIDVQLRQEIKTAPSERQAQPDFNQQQSAQQQQQQRNQQSANYDWQTWDDKAAGPALETATAVLEDTLAAAGRYQWRDLSFKHINTVI